MTRRGAKKRAHDETVVEPHNTSTGGNCNQNDFEEDFYEDVGTKIIDDIYMPPPPVQPNLSGDQTGQRLIIENIEITNFKSYGGTTILGPFHKSFNSIVGPNGSGKSNVIDSMLFVFGYRAAKLRSAKISNIIHNSDTMPDCQFAKVTVNFAMLDDKGGEDHIIINNSRFSISRVVEKNNNSYYLIGNNRVTFRDVSKKLQEFGVDLRYNRFLILQGEVEQISLMKPKAENPNDTGMLEFLEDIVGTSRYKDPIDKLSAKYAALNEERSQFINRVNMCKKELKATSAEKDEAVKALELANRQKIEKSKLIQHAMHEVSQSLQTYEEEYTVEQKKMDELDQKLKESEDKKTQLDGEMKTKSKQYKKLQTEATEFKEKFKEFETKDYELDQKKKNASHKLKKVKKQLQEDHRKVEELRAAVEAAKDNTEIEQLESRRAEMQNELKLNEEEMKKETEAAQIECKPLIDERRELDNALMQFKSQQTDKLNAMNEAHNKMTVLKEKGHNAQAKFEQLSSKLAKVQEETAEKEAAIVRFQSEIPVQEKKYNEISQELAKLEEQQTKLTEELNTQNEELQILLSDAQQEQSRDQVRNALMDQVEKGNLKGIYGRLGALGAIDKKYDVAISTSCGRLDQFVVDTMDNAVKAMKFVKESQISQRAVTFISLDKLPPWTRKWQRQESFPENVPRLFDLVRVNDKQFLPAFYFALSDTLVANDLDQATRIGYGTPRYRVVSLKGEIIEPDGSLSGGGKPRSGGMGTSVAESQVDRKKIAVLEQEVKNKQEKKLQIANKIESLGRDVKALENDLKIMNDKLGSFKLEVTQNATRVEQFKENLRVTREELDRLKDNPEIMEAEREYQKAKKIYEKEEEKMAAQQEKLDQYDAQIKERLELRLEPIRKQKESLEKKLKELQTKLTKISTERKSIDLNLKKTEDSLAANEAQKIELEEELEKIGEEKKKLEQLAKEITELYESSTQKCEEMEKEFGAIQQEVKKLDEEIKQAKNQKLDMKHEMDKKFKVLNEKRNKMEALQGELDLLVLDKIDDLDSDSEDECDEEEDEEENEEEGELQEGQTEDAMEVDSENEESMQVDPAGEGTSKGVSKRQFEQPAEPVSEKRTKKKRKKKQQPQIPHLTPEQCEAVVPSEVKRTIEKLDAELKKLSPNYSAIEQYRIKRADFKAKNAQLTECTIARDTYMDHLKATKERRSQEFKKGCYTIARKLKELYRTITLGGDADLEFIDSLDPFAEGVNFAVRPNKKSWKNNINLSGGEKTLASLALIFALHYYKPSPLYIMDEIDAALDFKNVSIIANYIKQRTRNTQFLIISLRNNMYENAEMLIGVYKTFNVSKTIPFNPIAFEEKKKEGTSQNMPPPSSSIQ